MKNLTLIDHPVYVSREGYDKAIDRMTEKLKRLPGIISIYQIGSISDLGISDIDILVVFKDGVSYLDSPRSILSSIEKYLFFHELYGISKSLFYQAGYFTIFHNNRLLYGLDLNLNNSVNEDNSALKIQLALEYLLKLYITLTVQRVYRIIKLRSLLLEVKAINYDIDFLGIKKGRLWELVRDLIEIRKDWFNKNYSDFINYEWFDDFYKELELVLLSKLEENGIFTNNLDCFKFSKNIIVQKSKHSYWEHIGFVLPSVFAKFLKKKYFNLNHRYNYFKFYIKSHKINNVDFFNKRMNFEDQCIEYNRENIPYYLPLKSSLNITKLI